jgi:hypothetical protein
MDRRGFLRSLVGGVAVGAAVRTWPFRVYSFPSQIKSSSFIVSSNLFQPGDDILFLHPTQAKALNDLVYRITAVDQVERTISFEAIRQSQYHWKNLNRSPQCQTLKS